MKSYSSLANGCTTTGGIASSTTHTAVAVDTAHTASEEHVSIWSKQMVFHAEKLFKCSPHLLYNVEWGIGVCDMARCHKATTRCLLEHRMNTQC